MEKKDIKSMTLRELTAEPVFREMPAYRVGQVFSWLQKGVASFDEMTNIPKNIREILRKNYNIVNCIIQKKLVSGRDDTVKYLYALGDGERVESVVMRYRYGYSICVSTQAGCPMGCAFCASALGGFSRNLTPSEILSQIDAAERDRGITVSHIDLMGTGEPLRNLENVSRFLELVAAPEGRQISMRRVSLSTCGIVDQIRELIPEKPQFTLSVSLHAPNDALRNQIMPVNQKWGVDELLAVCRAYAEATRRRISFEYALIRDFNDTDACARELAGRLKGMLCHVNLIPMNEVKGSRFRGSSPDRTRKFAAALTNRGLNVTIRRTLGSDIAAACGQLRAAHDEAIF